MKFNESSLNGSNKKNIVQPEIGGLRMADVQIPIRLRGKPATSSHLMSSVEDRANLTGLVLDCIEAKFCK